MPSTPKPQRPAYASDTRPSMPRPPQRSLHSVPMFGFVFTEKGLFHDITDVGAEQIGNPFAQPDVDD